jgi:hypothetical protein
MSTHAWLVVVSVALAAVEAALRECDDDES